MNGDVSPCGDGESGRSGCVGFAGIGVGRDFGEEEVELLLQELFETFAV